MNANVRSPFHVLFFTDQVSLPDLQKYVRTMAQELYREAITHNLEITGPVYWMYYGMDGNPDTVFTLEIAVPVTPDSYYSGKFQIKHLDAFKHISCIHEGDWARLPETYGRIFQEIGAKQLIPSGICREIYTFMDFESPDNHITEVQVGIL